MWITKKAKHQCYNKTLLIVVVEALPYLAQQTLTWNIISTNTTDTGAVLPLQTGHDSTGKARSLPMGAVCERQDDVVPA